MANQSTKIMNIAKEFMADVQSFEEPNISKQTKIKKKRKRVESNLASKNDTTNKETDINNKSQPQNIGIYLPPHKKQQKLQQEVLVPNSPEYQRRAWFALKGSINICINKADASNVSELVVDLFRENLIWGKGLLVRTLMRSQMAAPGYSNVLAAVVAVINTKLPEVGELLCRRLVMQFQRSYRRNDKFQMNAVVSFVAHLVNQYVVNELLALELLSLLLETPTDDSVEVAIAFIKQCGMRLSELTPKGLYAILETFRAIIHEGKVNKKVQYSIEGLFEVVRIKFQSYPAVVSSLDLVDEEDAIVHEVNLKDRHDIEQQLDVFRPMDPDAFAEQETLYDQIKAEILGDSSDEEEGASASGEYDTAEDEGEDKEEPQHDDKGKVLIEDKTSTDLVNLRRSIYLTIMSSISHDEAAHKILKIQIKEHEEPLVAEMILDVCANERTFRRDIGQLGERLCKISSAYADAFDDLFGKRYTIIHRYETTKLRNMAQFFAFLIVSEAVAWDVLEYIKLTEADTTSSSRIFIKILFQSFAQWLGLKNLKKKIEGDSLQEALSGIFPRDNPKDIRFCINFFTSIKLGALTEGMRSNLEAMQKKVQEQRENALDSSTDQSSDSESESESETTSSDDPSQESSSYDGSGDSSTDS